MPPRERLPWLALAAAAAAVVVAGLRRALGSDPRELAASLQDDSLYYLLPAFRAWQHGGRWTFDGENPTYGVQPTYAALLTAVAGFCPDRTALLVAAYALSFALFAAAAVTLARACAGPGHRGPLAGAVLLANLPLLYGATTLKENALSALLVAWLLLLLRRAAAASAAAAALPLGCCGGLLLATRLSPSTVLLLGTAALLLERVRPPSAWRWRAAAGMVLGAGPFLAYGLWLSGRWLPTSGSVKLWPLAQALADGSYWPALPGYLATVPGYLLACLAYATGLPHGFFHVPQSPPPSAAAGALLLPLTVAGLAALLRRRAGARHGPPGLLLLAAAVVAGEATNPPLLGPFGGIDYFQWYVAALPLLVAAIASAATAWLPSPAAGWLAVGLAGLAGVQALTAIQPTPVFTPDPATWRRQMLVATERMNALLPSRSRVAAANAGNLGFFARDDITVVNCDGLANDAVFDALRGGESLRQYLDRNRIGHVCDAFAPAGWHGNPVRDLEPIDVVPFHGPQYDGYLLAARAPRWFPDLWPLAGPRDPTATSTWRLVPWHEGDPLGAAPGAPSPVRELPSGRRGVYASLRATAPAAGDPGPVFYPGGKAVRFRAHAGGREGTLTLAGDGRRLADVPTGPHWSAIDLAVDGVARLDVHFVPGAGQADRVVWLAGIHWQTATAQGAVMPAAAASHRFGHGCDRAGEVPPALQVHGWEASPRAVTVQVTGRPRTSGVVWLASRADPLRVDDAGRRDPCFVWLDRGAVVASVPFTTDGAGHAAIPLLLPDALPAGNAYLQALLGTDPHRAALSNGVRLEVPAR